MTNSPARRWQSGPKSSPNNPTEMWWQELGGQGRMEPVPLVPPNIEALRPYEAGRPIESVRKQYGLTRIAKLASNENPLGASPKAVEAMANTLNALNLYPDGGLRLREVLASQFDLK